MFTASGNVVFTHCCFSMRVVINNVLYRRATLYSLLHAKPPYGNEREEILRNMEMGLPNHLLKGNCYCCSDAAGAHALVRNSNVLLLHNAPPPPYQLAFLLSPSCELC